VRLASLAHVKAGDRVLEPSAGNGALARAAINEGGTVTCVEIREEACRLLRALGLETRTSDFLLLTPGDFPARFDAVVMNPPFSRGADITHVTHAMRFLRPGGHLAAIMSAGVAYRSSASARSFRDLVAANGGRISPCPDGSFKEAGTMVRTVTVEMQRPG
jgi:16S rRNA G1207 methylase RsmC